MSDDYSDIKAQHWSNRDLSHSFSLGVGTVMEFDWASSWNKVKQLCSKVIIKYIAILIWRAELQYPLSKLNTYECFVMWLSPQIQTRKAPFMQRLLP